MISKAIICLGSNCSTIKILDALDYLSQLGTLSAGQIYPSDGDYFNCVASLSTGCDRLTLTDYTKKIEHRLGRRPEHKAQGRVVIDIDVIFFNSDLLRPLDASENYFLKGFEMLKNVKTVDGQ